ncbi:STAS domain-containing protein [Maritimibacter sp. DP1N21-5]|uniref:STAS domain-containing protein n=1 Tax=Maritimibacter sp. DP1N21-5 TaxID=2836867 RepID=UPI001C45F760|nr:STAS domain-containing protein [Maritimibacter sp. DP1N21-5]MBV7408809.1 STAS domain-containing protein [Maritimibacter sp. DP1N21-5]
MDLHHSDHSGTRIITVLDPRIDAAVAIQFKDQMRALIDGGPDRIVLDLSRVGFIDSSGLGAIVASMKQAATPQRLELAGLTRNVQKVFSLTRMDRVFIIHAGLSSITGGLADAG